MTSGAELRTAAIPDRDPAAAMIQPSGMPFSVAFSPHGARLAVGSHGFVQLVDASDGTTLRIVLGHSGAVTGCCSLPRSPPCSPPPPATARPGSGIAPPAPPAPSSKATPTGSPRPVSPDGTLLATAARDGTAPDPDRHRHHPRRPGRPHQLPDRRGVLPRRHPARHRHRRPDGAGSGISPPAPPAPSSKATPTGSTPRRSPPTAPCSPPPAATARPGSGTWPPAPPPLSSKATPATARGGVLPRRHPARHRLQRPHGPALGSRHRHQPHRPPRPPRPAPGVAVTPDGTLLATAAVSHGRGIWTCAWPPAPPAPPSKATPTG